MSRHLPGPMTFMPIVFIHLGTARNGPMVLLISASKLPGGLAIVSPLALAVEGEFNNQGGRKAASLSARRVSGVTIG